MQGLLESCAWLGTIVSAFIILNAEIADDRGNVCHHTHTLFSYITLFKLSFSGSSLRVPHWSELGCIDPRLASGRPVMSSARVCEATTVITIVTSPRPAFKGGHLRHISA